MRFSAIVIFTLVLFSFGVCLKLPDYISKCKFPTGFKDCVLKNIQKTLPRLVKNGDKQFRINNLNPIVLKKFMLQATPTLVVELSNVTFGDFNTLLVKDIQMDFKNNKMSMQYDLDRFIIDGKYSMDGQILMLKLSGSGNLSLVCTACTGKYEAKLTGYTELGYNYFKLSDDSNNISPTKCVSELTNLFGGDKIVGAQINALLNQNWEDFYTEGKPALSNAFAGIMTAITNKFLTQVPVEDLIEFEKAAT